tara:strand:+ start:27293 stop:28645 length:1353 start_codon:yes stop_codon:yes gene_type:complete
MIQNKFYSSIYIFLVVLFISCGSSKKIARQFEELPEWIKQKPQNEVTYYGVGKAPKSGFPDVYIKAAEKQALTDLAEQISVKVNATSLLYQFEIDNQKSDFYMNKQNIETTNFFEGYTISKTYENEDFYWNLIEIYKSKYLEIKRLRKTTTLEKAYQYYVAGQLKKEARDLYTATSFFIKSLETLKPYWSENTKFTTKTGKSIDLAIENTNEIQFLFKGLAIQKKKNTLTLKRGDFLAKNTAIAVLTHAEYGVLEHFPYTITTSITLEKSKQLYTKETGLITSLPIKVITQNNKENLEISVDGKEILKKLTTDLMLRKILINSIPEPLKSTIHIEVLQPKINVILSSKDKGLSLEKTALETINHFEKKGINTPLPTEKTFYTLFIEITQIGKEAFKISTKLRSPLKENLYNTMRTINIDPFVYPTQEKMLNSILNSLKRKEFSKTLALIL